MPEFIQAQHDGIEGHAHVTREALDKMPGWTEVKTEDSPEEATSGEDTSEEDGEGSQAKPTRRRRSS